MSSGYVAPVEDYLAGVAGAHGGEAVFVVAPVHAMGDDGGDVEAGLEHDGHHVPGLVHLAAVDSRRVSWLKTTWFQSMAICSEGIPSMAILPPWLMLPSISRKAEGLPDISSPTSKPSCMCNFLLDFIEGYGSRVYGAGYSDFFGEVAAIFVGIGDDDVARAGVTSDGSGHDADGTGSGDEDVFAEDREGERGVNGVAEGVEDGGDFERDAGRVLPDVGHGQATNSAKAPLRFTPTPMVWAQR